MAIVSITSKWCVSIGVLVLAARFFSPFSTMAAAAEPAPGALKFEITDASIPAGYADDIRGTYLEMRHLLYPILIVPTNVTVKVMLAYNNAAYRFDPKSQRIAVPYRFLPLNEQKPIEGREALPVFAHEFGHYIHFVNMMKKSPLIRDQVLNGVQRTRALLRQEQDACDRMLEVRMKMWREKAGTPEYADLEKQFNELKAADDALRISVKTEIEKFGTRTTALATYSELVADLMAVLEFDDPTVNMHVCSPTEIKCQARSFTNTIDVTTWTEDEEHIALGPARAAVWNLYLRKGLSKAALARLVIDATVVEIEKRFNGWNPSSVIEMNQSFVTTLNNI